MTALDQISTWQTQSLPAAWQLCAVHLPHLSHPCNLVMLPSAFRNSTLRWVVDTWTLLDYPKLVGLLHFKVLDFWDIFTRKGIKTKEIYLKPHFAIKEGTRKQNKNGIIKMVWCVPLPPLVMPKHPVSVGRVIAFLHIAEVKQPREPDSSRLVQAPSCMCQAALSLSSSVQLAWTLVIWAVKLQPFVSVPGLQMLVWT